MSSLLRDLQADLREAAVAADIPRKARYFQALPGGYAEGDQFLGVSVPEQRRIAKTYATRASAEDVRQLLRSAFHEERLCGVFVLIRKFTADRRLRQEKQWVDLFMDEIEALNNWDLIDSCAHIILGQWLLDKDRSILYQLARDPSMWKNRIALIAAGRFIREGEYADLLKLCEMLLSHPHHLIHKASGWMLRELWLNNPAVAESFLEKQLDRMPRVMLRYAIEKMPAAERKVWLGAGRGFFEKNPLPAARAAN